MTEEQPPSSTATNPRPTWTYFLVPFAIVIGAVLLSGNVKIPGLTARVVDSQPKTGTIQYTVDDLKTWAKTIKGLDRKAFNACLDSEKYREKVLKDHASGEALGMINDKAGTPSFFLNGKLLEPQGAQPVEFFRQAIDQAKGPIELIEYSDFQCPFCRKFFNETLPIIKKEYIDTGKIQFSYHHFFPIPGHTMAIPSAIASECARDQGKFWEMHDAIFTLQAKWIGFF